MMGQEQALSQAKTSLAAALDGLDRHFAAFVSRDAIALARRRLRRKAIVVVGLFFGGYALAILSDNLWLIVPGLIAVGVSAFASIASVMHDANHGATFTNPVLSRAIGYWLDVFGASSMVWCFKHNRVHHEYANVDGFDTDIQQQPFLRLNPHQRWRPWHRLQHLYAPVLYGFITVQVFASDFVNLVRGRVKNQRIGERAGIWDLIAFSAGKILFSLWAVVVPVLVHGWIALPVGFLVAWLVGIGLALTVQIAHAVDIVDHFPDPAVTPAVVGEVQAEADPLRAFVLHQADSTADVDTAGSVGAVVFRWLVGGLDRQVAHHLVPGLPHTLYPKLQAHVEELLASYGATYRSHPTLSAAVGSHFRFLRQMGRPPLAAAASA